MKSQRKFRICGTDEQRQLQAYFLSGEQYKYRGFGQSPWGRVERKTGTKGGEGVAMKILEKQNGMMIWNGWNDDTSDDTETGAK